MLCTSCRASLDCGDQPRSADGQSLDPSKYVLRHLPQFKVGCVDRCTPRRHPLQYPVHCRWTARRSIRCRSEPSKRYSLEHCRLGPVLDEGRGRLQNSSNESLSAEDEILHKRHLYDLISVGEVLATRLVGSDLIGSDHACRNSR